MGRFVTTLATPLTIFGSMFIRSPGLSRQSRNQPLFCVKSAAASVIWYEPVLVPLPAVASVCCSMALPRTLTVTPVSFTAYRLCTSAFVVSGTSSRRPVPNSTTRCGSVLLSTAHSVTSGRVVIGWPAPTGRRTTAPTSAASSAAPRTR